MKTNIFLQLLWTETSPIRAWAKKIWFLQSNYNISTLARCQRHSRLVRINKYQIILPLFWQILQNPISVGICSFYLSLSWVLKWRPDWQSVCTKHIMICRPRNLWQHDASFIITFVTQFTCCQQTAAHANWLLHYINHQRWCFKYKNIPLTSHRFVPWARIPTSSTKYACDTRQKNLIINHFCQILLWQQISW